MKSPGWILLGLCLSTAAWAQTLEAREQAIAQERVQIARQREQVQQDHEREVRACWQRFAVNDCLAQVRQARRQRAEPLRQRELELNALSRQLREERRQLRLQDADAPVTGAGP